MNAAPRRPAQGDPLALPNEILVLEIHRIRRDGDTQGRVALNESIIQEYANLMRAGVEFPPVRTWFDGCAYWLSDGFQRMAAAELVGLNQISAEVFRGTLEDARWDSYAANAAHGLRRTRADIEVIIRRAVEHPKGSQISSRELARHLGMPEPTLSSLCLKSKTSSPENVLALESCYGDGNTQTERAAGSAVVRKRTAGSAWAPLLLPVERGAKEGGF